MKPSEILKLLPQWEHASSADIVASPAWSVPCRMGETACTLKAAEVVLSDTLDVSIVLGGTEYVLSIADSPVFADLHSLWANRADVPEPILLALVEKECGMLLQTIENVVRRELKVLGVAKGKKDESLSLALDVSEGQPISFMLSSTPQLVRAFGQLAFIDVSNPIVRDARISVVRDMAAFTLSAADMMSIGPGDALIVPEFDSSPARLIAESRLIVDGNGVSPYADDGLLHIVESAPGTVTLGWLLDYAASPSQIPSAEPGEIKLVAGGRTIAVGKVERLGGQPVMKVESKG